MLVVTKVIKFMQASQLHPSIRARLGRFLRFGRNLNGWTRLTNFIVGTPSDPRFRVRNETGWFEGRTDSVIERQVYLKGGYEEGFIRAFLTLFPEGKRTCIVDVGANIGTHSLAFAQIFERVVCFDPSHSAFASLTRNLSLNPGKPITSVNCGLGDVAETRAFYNIFNGNDGLGTFVCDEQYDKPLEKIAEFPIVRGDDILPEILGNDKVIDAIKIDIQGFEPNTLIGLRSTLERHRPLVWMEIGQGTHTVLGGDGDLASLFPYPVDLLEFRTSRNLLVTQIRLEKRNSIKGLVGDIVVCPRR